MFIFLGSFLCFSDAWVPDLCGVWCVIAERPHQELPECLAFRTRHRADVAFIVTMAGRIIQMLLGCFDLGCSWVFFNVRFLSRLPWLCNGLGSITLRLWDFHMILHDFITKWNCKIQFLINFGVHFTGSVWCSPASSYFCSIAGKASAMIKPVSGHSHQIV